MVFPAAPRSAASMARKSSRAVKSSARDRLGGDHPRLRAQAYGVERPDNMIQVDCGHLVPPLALHAQTRQQDDEGLIAAGGGAIDGLRPAAAALKIDAKIPCIFGGDARRHLA